MAKEKPADLEPLPEETSTEAQEAQEALPATEAAEGEAEAGHGAPPQAETKKKPPSHFQDFAHELVARHGPRTVGMMVHEFLNRGNFLPGETLEAVWQHAEAELKADPRFEVVSNNPGRGLDWFGHAKDCEDGHSS